MRAIVVNETGGPEVLVHAEEHPDPEPGPGQVVVEAAAAGVNFIDIYRRSGVYQQPLPYVPGSEGAGTVVAVGEGVTDVAVGDRVAWHDAAGSYAERVVVDAGDDRPGARRHRPDRRRRRHAAGHDRALPVPLAPSRSSRGRSRSCTRPRAGSACC